jgi:hypothetical protein
MSAEPRPGIIEIDASEVVRHADAIDRIRAAGLRRPARRVPPEHLARRSRGSSANRPCRCSNPTPFAAYGALLRMADGA